MQINNNTRPYRIKNLLGQTFDHLTAIGFVSMIKNHAAWLWKCTCGNYKIIVGRAVTSANTKSCGCLNRKVAAETRTTHGLSRTLEYKTWQRMKQRCSDPHNKDFSNYGGRGIEVCDRWQKFEHFFADMGKRPDGLTLDRKDNDGNYCPENCHWASPTAQANNRQSNHMLTFQGKTQSVAEWSREVHIKYGALRSRLVYGWSVERSLTEPVRGPVVV